jgi:prevent-host-death family protein
MPTVTVHEAKTNLSELLRRVEAGEEIVIARGDKPVAILKSYDRAEIARKRAAGRGCLAGKFPPVPDEVWFGMSDDKSLAEMFGQEFVDMMTPRPELEQKAPHRSPKAKMLAKNPSTKKIGK